ncbi:MAG: sulfatase-like hydrolase/transferase [bacterium]|nr:sulfatase-like hydrolase/transferase [bacterium]
MGLGLLQKKTDCRTVNHTETYDWWEGLDWVEEEGYTTHLITQHSVQFIKDNKDRPFCLYVAHEAVHNPLQGPDDPAIRGPKKEDFTPDDPDETYCQMMKAMDDSLGDILATVRESGIAEKTLVIFFSDNGGTPRNPLSNAPLRGHKGTVWEGGHRVPAIAWWPGKIRPGTITDQLGISLDLMPTMLDLAGASTPDGHTFDGTSLKSLLLDGNDLGSRQLFWNGKAMRDDTWKLVIDNETPQLFDLAHDIGETNNLADQHPERVQTMVQAIDAWKEDVKQT